MFTSIGLFDVPAVSGRALPATQGKQKYHPHSLGCCDSTGVYDALLVSIMSGDATLAVLLHGGAASSNPEDIDCEYHSVRSAHS